MSDDAGDAYARATKSLRSEMAALSRMADGCPGLYVGEANEAAKRAWALWAEPALGVVATGPLALAVSEAGRRLDAALSRWRDMVHAGNPRVLFALGGITSAQIGLACELRRASFDLNALCAQAWRGRQIGMADPHDEATRD